MRASHYTVLTLVVASILWARDNLVAGTSSPGRSLLSHSTSQNETEAGMLVTYWGQNSAAPKYQEPSLDQVRGTDFVVCAGRRDSSPVVHLRSSSFRPRCLFRAGVCSVQHHSNCLPG